MSVTLRIERLKGGIRLSGEFRLGHLDQVKTEIKRCESPGVLDLEEVDLIDLEGVRFLNACEAKGISVLKTVRLTSGNGCCKSESEERSHKLNKENENEI